MRGREQASRKTRLLQVDNPRTDQGRHQEIQRNESKKSWGTWEGNNYGSILCGGPTYYESVLFRY